LRDALEEEYRIESVLCSQISNKPSGLHKARARAQAKTIAHFERQIWVAANWIVEGAGSLLQDMTSRRKLSEDDARALSVGELYGDKDKDTPLSIHRWYFWKQRFAALEILLDQSSDTTQHVRKALRCMALAEKKIDLITESHNDSESESESESTGDGEDSQI
jgi:hypothetical protein